MEIIFLKTQKQYQEISPVIQCISTIQRTFTNLYSKYLEENEVKKGKKLISSRTYYIINEPGVYDTKYGIIQVEENSYTFKDYKFVDTRVTHLKNNPKVCVLNISCIENLADSIDSIGSAYLHDVLHVLNDYM